METSSLTVYAVGLGALLLCFSLARIVFPRAMQAGLLAFPRNVWAGRMLTAIDIALIAWLLLSEGFAWVDARRQLVFIAAPAAYLLVVFFMDELLAARALGGLFLLIPFWILKAAFMHPAPSRLLMTCVAYLLVVKGIALIWSPYIFRKIAARAAAGTLLGSLGALAGTLLGLAMIILGLVAY